MLHEVEGMHELMEMKKSSPTSRYEGLILARNKSDPSDTTTCYVCVQMQQRKPACRQSGPSKTCILCNHPFCAAHQQKRNVVDNVCEINHSTYYQKVAHRVHAAPVRIFASVENRQSWIEIHSTWNVAGAEPAGDKRHSEEGKISFQWTAASKEVDETEHVKNSEPQQSKTDSSASRAPTFQPPLAAQ